MYILFAFFLAERETVIFPQKIIVDNSIHHFSFSIFFTFKIFKFVKNDHTYYEKQIKKTNM